MSKGFTLLTLAFAAAFAAATPTYGQTLQVQVTSGGATTNIAANSSQTLTSPGIGLAVFANVAVTNTGSATVTINSVSLTGTPEMTLSSAAGATLSPNGNLVFSVEYLPTNGAAATGQIVINYTVSGAVSAFQFNLTGVTPSFTFSYALPTGGSVALSPGGAIAFPATTVGASVTAVVTVVNSGSATGTLQTVASTGSGFLVTGIAPPAQLIPGQQTSFNVVFTAQSSGAAQGSLVLGFTNSSASFTLTGTGASPSFTVTYTLADGNVHPLLNGSAINFPSVDINATATAVVNILNQGTGAGTVTGISVTGAGFRGASEPAPGATVAAGQGVTFQILFNPTQAGSFSGAFSITLSGTSISGTLAGSTSSPNFSLEYQDPVTKNIFALPNGATLPFPNTLVNTVAAISVIVANTGAGTGLLNSINLGGSSPSVFQILNQPSLPASVPPNQQLTFAVQFSPMQQQTFSATLIVNLNGQAITINLAAQGTGPQYAYTSSSAAGSTAVSPGGTIAIGSTSVGQTSSLIMSVLNKGTGNGQVSTLGVTGQGLSISNAPTIPFALAPNASQTFTLNFAPTQPGPVNGTLTIGTDTFTVTATGAGPLLTYSYTNSASTISVAAGGVVIFQPTAVESQSSVTFSVQNTGTVSTAISSINLAAASPVFSLQQQPTQPTNLAPGGTITFTVNFVPNALGTLTASLLVNNVAFTLSGTGTQPAALPAYQFQGPSGTVTPAQQPSIGLTLSAPYPLALQGVLTLTFTSAVFANDPSIQFAAGGRTVTFTIPANSTQAVFTGGATSMPMQTGTTAGTILITPSFATQNGFDLTPASPTSLTLTIPSAIAQLSSENVTSETLSSFTVVLGGYTTTHALTQLNIQINPKSGDNFSTSSLTINVSSASSAWYQSTASTPFGGAFLIAIPFVLSNGSTTTDLVHMLQSLTITATNSVGVSSSISVPIP
jgi:Abnormal spindle-like microcephaly-assoc'd, ASPM-SPD-2-Hydin